VYHWWSTRHKKARRKMSRRVASFYALRSERGRTSVTTGVIDALTVFPRHFNWPNGKRSIFMFPLHRRGIAPMDAEPESRRGGGVLCHIYFKVADFESRPTNFRPATDHWKETLQCPKCDKTGMASLSQIMPTRQLWKPSRMGSKLSPNNMSRNSIASRATSRCCHRTPQLPVLNDLVSLSKSRGHFRAAVKPDSKID
jgi:hypothetical protein